MEITSAMVKELREKTNAGILDCKKALAATGADMEKAVDYLRKKGLSTALKRSGRVASEGQVVSYIHSGGKIGVLLEVNCETDFVGRTPEFHDFAYNIAMHIAAMNPLCIRREDVLPEVLDREKDIYRTRALESGKPEKVVEKIIQGRIEKFYQEACLLEQAYVKNQDLTVQDYLNELIAKMGEKTDIRRFVRFQLGESAA